MGLPVLPPGLKSLDTLLAEGLYNVNVNLIGVVVDCLPAHAIQRL